MRMMIAATIPHWKCTSLAPEELVILLSTNSLSRYLILLVLKITINNKNNNENENENNISNNNNNNNVDDDDDDSNGLLTE